VSDSINLHVNNTGIGDDFPVRLMGIINISGESFYKGSVYDPGSVPGIAERMINEGVTFLDIGGRSTAPHANPITVTDEITRVQSALETLFSRIDIGNTLVSIDTQYRKVAETAFTIMNRYNKSNQFVLNDVSCLCTDPSLADWLRDVERPVILMAAHHVPGDSLGITETIDDLSRSIRLLGKKGYPVEKNVIIDPAIGKWIPEKSSSFDCELIAHLKEFRKLQQPLLVGISRKSFVGTVLHKKGPEERYQGTLAATAIAVFNGAHIVRTHDVDQEIWDTVAMAQALRNGII
jgi:dihydropteroate synthase